MVYQKQNVHQTSDIILTHNCHLEKILMFVPGTGGKSFDEILLDKMTQFHFYSLTELARNSSSNVL
jgi:hypothetical protein